MTQIHPDTRPDTTGDGGQPPQQSAPEPWAAPSAQQPQATPHCTCRGTAATEPPAAAPAQGEPTTPVWFGQTQEIPRDHAALGLPGVAGDPTRPRQVPTRHTRRSHSLRLGRPLPFPLGMGQSLPSRANGAD